MDINQKPYPKDLPQLNPNRCPFTASHSAPFLPISSTAGDPFASDEAAEDQPSARKVKLLCSFGGKILPRPSDGALRYAGGQTRIIAVRRDITLPEIFRKMTGAYGGPVAIRYQLPDEDLDALVSVSSTEDLDNMMDEYDKLAESSVDGSAKLRVFLFSQAEITSVLTENFSTGPTLDPYDSGQKYIEAVNGGTVSQSSTYVGETRLKGSTASAVSTHNSDRVFDGSNNEGTSPPVLSPTAGASACLDPSKLAFVATATSLPLQETHGFPASSTILGQMMAATQPLNPPQVVPYHSQAFVETHQVHCAPHSLNMAAASRIGNVSAPQRTYLPPLTMAPASVSSQAGSMKPVQVKVDPFSKDDQFVETFVQPVSDPTYKVSQQPLCQIPTLQSSHFQPSSVEPHELHVVPPLPKGPRLRFEECQMCQRALPHVHSDMLINELGNVSGISMPKTRPMLHSHHSDDIARLHGEHMIVSVAMMESFVEPKFEHTVNPDQNGTCGVNKVPDSVLSREKFFMPTAEKIDHSKLGQPLGSVGLSGDTETSYGVIVNSPESHLESSFHQQKKHVLHGETFHPSKFLHPTGIFSISSSGHSNGVYLSQQNHHDDYLQQLNVLSDVNADYIQARQSSGTMGLSSTGETSYGVSLRPPRPHDETFQQQQLFGGTVPPLVPVKQVVSSKQFSRDSLPYNVSYDALEPLSQAQDYVKQVDGITETLNSNTFDILRCNGQLKPTVGPIVDVSKDMKRESLFVGVDSHTIRPQNGGNALLSSNVFVSSTVGSEGISVKPVNPVISNSGISKEINYESASGAGEDHIAVSSYCGGSKLSLSNAPVTRGLPPKEYTINPLLSSTMNLHVFELANTSLVSTITGSSVYTQNSEKYAKPLFSNQRLPEMPSYFTDTAYTSTITGGTSGVCTNEVSQVQHLISDISAPQRGNAPFPLSSSTILGRDKQFQETFPSGSILGNANCQEILESMDTYRSRAVVVASREPPVSGDTSNEYHFSKVKVPDIAMLLEDGSLQPPTDWLIKDSHSGSVETTKEFGEDFMKQDLCKLASREPTLSGDSLNENHLSNVKVPDIAVLLEEGALQPPADWLIKDLHPGSSVATKESGADFIKQDLCDLAKQDGKSVFQSSIAPASVLAFSGPKELSSFPRGTGLCEDNSNSQSAAALGDQRIEDIKVKQSDELHMGLPIVNDIGRLQIVKSCDLEELSELGSGTFGTVFHGKWRGSDVAIKRINDRCFTGKPSEQEKMRGDFWNEASKLADLHHPNVVAFYGVVLDGPGGSFATVTEYMVNGSLRNALQRNDKTIDRRKRLIIAMDVAFGMEYLHGKNIVHFDLKSDNLLVNLRDPQRPICKVGDLGLSKVKCQTLISGGVRGTLPWMAPELLNGSSNLVSDKVDVFSFGIVMWELLTGEEPYSDLHYGTIIGGIVSNTLRPPVPESCDPEWRALMEQCWSAEPSERPSFTEIANRLRTMASSLPQKGKAQK